MLLGEEERKSWRHRETETAKQRQGDKRTDGRTDRQTRETGFFLPGGWGMTVLLSSSPPSHPSLPSRSVLVSPACVVGFRWKAPAIAGRLHVPFHPHTITLWGKSAHYRASGKRNIAQDTETESDEEAPDEEGLSSTVF